MHKGENREQVCKKVLDSAFSVHSELGPGLLENVYEHCLYFDLVSRGLQVERQKGLPVIYSGVKIDLGYRLDLLVEEKVIVEIKAVESLADIHLSQILTYLKISGCKLGLLINFNSRHLKDGIRRVVR